MRCVVRIKVKPSGPEPAIRNLNEDTIYFVCEIEWKFRRRIQTAIRTYTHIHGDTQATYIWCGDNSVWQYVFFGFRIKWWRRQRCRRQITQNTRKSYIFIYISFVLHVHDADDDDSDGSDCDDENQSGIALTRIFMVALLFYVCSTLSLSLSYIRRSFGHIDIIVYSVRTTILHATNVFCVQTMGPAVHRQPFP